MSTCAISADILFGSPKDWDRRFWRTYFEDFLEILWAACPPDGQELYIAGEIQRRGLRSA